MIELTTVGEGGLYQPPASSNRFQFSAGAIQGLSDSAPPMDVVRTNVRTIVRKYDGVDQEVFGSFICPVLTNLTTVTVRFTGYPSDTPAGTNVRYTLRVEHLTDGDGADSSHADYDSGDVIIDPTQDEILQYNFSLSLSTLGWVAGELIKFKLTRVTSAGGVNFSSGFNLMNLTLDII